MKKSNYKTIKLGTGEINLYDFGEIKLHAYKTNDPLADEVFVLEKNGKIVVIESPCFFSNIEELNNYISSLYGTVEGVLVSYHASGATFLPTAKKYATKHADEYGHNGGGKALIDSFTNSFGSIFDNSIHKTTDFLNAGKINIGGIDFEIIDNDEGYDIIIPEINAIYTHMLGHDCHSIVVGSKHADLIISTLQGYIIKGYNLVLTSHYTPEDLKDVKTKIDYLLNLKEIASRSKNGEEFKREISKTYPNYLGENYLDMTTAFFFPTK